MLAATLLGVWLVQAPVLPGSGAPPFTPSVKEWSLAGGAFTLKRENFLRWQPVFDPFRGWRVELRPVWLLELAPTHPRLANLSLAVESTAAPAEGGGVGIVRPRLQYRVPGTQTRVGVELPIAAFFSSTLGGGMRVFRPMAFVSGRF